MSNDDDHFSWWEAARFLRHCRVHASHTDALWFDEATDAVRCRECGRWWASPRARKAMRDAR